MKKIFIAILLVFCLIFTNYSIDVNAAEVKLLPACVVTANGEKWGYIDETGVTIIKPTYDFVKDFNDKGVAIVANGEYSYDLCEVYFINKSGKIISGPFTSNIPDFNNGVAIIKNSNKSSLIVDEYGKVILESKYNLFEYSEGLVSFSDPNNKLCGYMDLKGKVILPAKYVSVNSFSDGKAIVEVSADKFSVIDKTGRVIDELKYYSPYSTSEGLTAYEDTKSHKYGYKDKTGAIIIKPQFDYAMPFKDGYATVEIYDEKYNRLNGLIDKKGNYVIKPEYSGITLLGHGLFSVSKNFSSPNIHWYAPKAIFNVKGEQLTDYTYHRVSEYDGDYAVASDNTTTFFIDREGEIVEKLPKLQGIGEMKFIGDIIKAELDEGLIYLKESGDIIWQKDETIPLGNNINVKVNKYRKDYLTYIEYPEITGIYNKAVQESVNKKLKNHFIEYYETSQNKDDEEFFEENHLSFSAALNKDLLIVEKSGYWYPIGAAHGQGSKDYLYIDIKTGAFYELKDLFKANSKYTEKLASIVNNQLKLNTKIGAISGEFFYFEDNVKVANNQGFIIGSDSIKFYYHPYEISAYAFGFPEFEIPYGQITSIIDTKGAFWNSFDKKIVNHKINVISNIKDSTVKSIESLMSSYEKNIIEAINSNNFSKVEASLLKGSNLYNSQKKLVESLNKQKIKEKLTKYQIYAIDYDYAKEEYRVYVQEEIAIKYSGKDYVNKKFEWYYSVKADNSGKLLLSDINKW